MLKVGDLIFFNWEGGIFRKLIILYNNINYGFSKTTHVGIVTEVHDDHYMIAESLSKGFKEYPYDKWWLDPQIKEGQIIAKRPNKPLKNVKAETVNYLGREYAIQDLASIILFFIIGMQLPRATGAKKLICSEAVARVLYDSSNKEIDFEKELNKPYDLITPMDLYISNQLTFIN